MGYDDTEKLGFPLMIPSNLLARTLQDSRPTFER